MRRDIVQLTSEESKRLKEFVKQGGNGKTPVPYIVF